MICSSYEKAESLLGVSFLPLVDSFLYWQVDVCRIQSSYRYFFFWRCCACLLDRLRLTRYIYCSSPAGTSLVGRIMCTSMANTSSAQIAYAILHLDGILCRSPYFSRHHIFFKHFFQHNIKRLINIITRTC